MSDPAFQREDEFFQVALDLVQKAGRVSEIFLRGNLVSARFLQLVKDAFAQPCGRVDTKASAIDLVTEYDKKVEELLINGLTQKFPDHQYVACYSPFISGSKAAHLHSQGLSAKNPLPLARDRRLRTRQLG